MPRRKLTISEIDVEEKKRDADAKARAASVSPSPTNADAPADGEKKEGEEEKKPEAAAAEEAEKPVEEVTLDAEPLEDLKEKFIETDQDDRVTQMNGRVNIQQPGYMVFHTNQFAARAHRHDFVA